MEDHDDVDINTDWDIYGQPAASQQQQNSNLQEVLTAIDTFRLLPRPSRRDTQLLNRKLLLCRSLICSASEAQQQSEERWQSICSMVMDQCYLQQEAGLDLLKSALQVDLDQEPRLLEKLKQQSDDPNYPVVVGNKATEICKAIFSLRRAVEDERAEDAKNLKQAVVANENALKRFEEAECAATSTKQENEKLLNQSVDMAVEIGRLREEVRGLKEALKISATAQEADMDSDTRMQIGNLVADFLKNKRRKA